jgi:hypothetical protein
MVKQQLMISPPPMKKQTLAEKKYIIKNFEQCLSVYNHWIDMNPSIGNPVDANAMSAMADLEQQRWKPSIIGSSQNSTNLLSD